jgi:hypothetical protein
LQVTAPALATCQSSLPLLDNYLDDDFAMRSGAFNPSLAGVGGQLSWDGKGKVT